MKKLMFLLAFVTVIFTVQAQMSTSNLTPGNTYTENPTDVILTGTVAQYWQINAPQNYYTGQSITIQLDSLAGTHTTVTVAISGRVSDQTATWTSIGSSIVWHGTTSDTTIIFTNATENAYRQYKVLFTGVGATGTTTIDNREFKQWFGLP